MRKVWALFAITAMVAVAACGSDSTSPGGGGASGPPVQTNQVSVGNDFFDPANIQVPVGTTVTWTWNSGGTAHNVTFADTASANLTGGATFSRTFGTAGTFAYSCTIHGQTGSVLVQ
jgi:plastocyanin